MEEYLNTIANHLVETDKVKLNTRGQVSTGSNKKIYTLIDREMGIDLDLTLKQIASLEAKESNLRVLCQGILEKRLRSAKEERLERIKGDYGQVNKSKIDLSSFKLFLNYEYSGPEHSVTKDLLIRDKDDNKASIGSSTFFRLYTHEHPEKEAWQELRSILTYGVEIYAPYQILETREDRYFPVERDGHRLIGLNLCTHPFYRYLNPDNAKPLPEKDLEFIKTCFSSEESFLYFCAWSFTAITQRMPVYLVLLGSRGIGKTTLVEILSHMVGEDNFFSSAQNGLTSNFDGFKENKRLIEFDEMKLTDEGAVNRVKKDANEVISIEKKGQDVKNAVNFFSGIISSNSTRDFKGIAFDERRLSFVDLTDKNAFDRGFDDTWIGEFKGRIKEEQWQLSFFKLLKQNTPIDFKPQRPFKGETFYTTLEENLSGAYLIIKEMITSKEYFEIQLSDVKSLMDNAHYFPTHHSNFIDFLRNYKHGKDKLILGEYVKGRPLENSKITVSEYFRPIDKEAQIEIEDNL